MSATPEPERATARRLGRLRRLGRRGRLAAAGLAAAIVAAVVAVVLLAGGDETPALDRAAVGEIASETVTKALEDERALPAASAVVYQQILPSLVRITTREEATAGAERQEGLGTGVIAVNMGIVTDTLLDDRRSVDAQLCVNQFWRIFRRVEYLRQYGFLMVFVGGDQMERITFIAPGFDDKEPVVGRLQADHFFGSGERRQGKIALALEEVDLFLA